MAMASASASVVRLRIQHPVFFFSSFLAPPPALVKAPLQSSCYHLALIPSTTRTRPSIIRSSKTFVVKEELPEAIVDADEEVELSENNQTLLYSFSPLPLLFAAALLPGGALIVSILLFQFHIIFMFNS